MIGPKGSTYSGEKVETKLIFDILIKCRNHQDKSKHMKSIYCILQVFTYLLSIKFFYSYIIDSKMLSNSVKNFVSFGGKYSLRVTSSLYTRRNVMNNVGENKEPANLRSKWPKATFNISKMQELLDHDNHQMRAELREFLSDPIFTPRYNIPLEEEREVNIFT